jgi:hypothetical protein
MVKKENEMIVGEELGTRQYVSFSFHLNENE